MIIWATYMWLFVNVGVIFSYKKKEIPAKAEVLFFLTLISGKHCS